MTVECSVLVPVLNEERHIATMIAAMQRQRFDGGLEFLLVDGGSSDRTRSVIAELARADPRIRLLHNPVGDTPAGLNVALREARGRWVARMDGHSEFPDDYLARGVERLKRGDTSWVSGPQVPVGEGRVSQAVVRALSSPLGRGGSRKWAQQTGEAGPEYELDSGVFCGVWERQVLLRFGGWDERFVRNQDSEMAGRFLAAGERLVCVPAMAASYAPRDSIKALWRQYFQYGRYRAMTAARHPHTLRRSALLPPAVVIATASAGVGPRRLRRAARLLVSAYIVALAGASVRAARDGEPPAGALLVPLVLAVMHYGHGAGFLAGSASEGPPLAALLRVLGFESLAAREAAAPEPVVAPSLDGGGGEDPADLSRGSGTPRPASAA